MGPSALGRGHSLGSGAIHAIPVGGTHSTQPSLSCSLGGVAMSSRQASTPDPGRENVMLRNWAQNKEGATDQPH